MTPARAWGTSNLGASGLLEDRAPRLFRRATCPSEREHLEEMRQQPEVLDHLSEIDDPEAFCAAVRAGADFIDIRFTDLVGRAHHVTLPATGFAPPVFRNGIGFDGSSVPGFKSLEHGDMVLLPEPATAMVDEIGDRVVVSMIAGAAEATTKRLFPLDPRYIATRAEEVLASSGHADLSEWSPELEFYLFSSVDYDDAASGAFYRIGSAEAGWVDPEDPDAALGYRIQPGSGYHAAPPCDMHFDLRNEMVARLVEAGVPVKYHHHENGAPGQVEIELLPEPLVRSSDHLMLSKYIIRNTALEWGVSATFMPKPLPDEAGSGLHFHIRLERGKRPVLPGEGGYAGLSREGLSFIGGILSHGRALSAVTNASTNSYRRLQPGHEAPTNLFFSAGNRSAAIRIPAYATEPDQLTIEYRPGDATANPYLAMAALLAAGLDGLEKRIDPRESGYGPYDENIHDLENGLRSKIAPLPISLEEALDDLEREGAFLSESGIFPESFVPTWVRLKRDEAESVRLRPHPAEYGLYFDC
ncbi:MAG: type I glutamate--ammonia ligase [Candidatus Eisenbacteria bacterium]|nr:type I glutamate--ammonia ligase [Candidatus Eisenbacteria bacterium]